MEGDVREDNDVFADAEEGVDVGLAVLIVPPVEVQHQGHGAQGHLKEKL